MSTRGQNEEHDARCASSARASTGGGTDVVVAAHDPWFGFPPKNDSCLASSSHRLDARCRAFQRQHDGDDANRIRRRGDFVRAFVRTHGVSHEVRPKLWLDWSGANARREASATSYADALANAESRGGIDGGDEDLKECFAQIEMDLERTFPEHTKFAEGGEALPALRRVLRALSTSLTTSGYVQGMNYLAGFLLLVMDEREDDAYWVLRCVVEDMFPGFYDAGLGQLRADLDTLDFRFSCVSREAHAKLDGMGLAVKYFTARWLMCCLIGCASVPLLTRVWDLLFVDADRKPRETILRCSLAILALQAPFIRAAGDMNASVDCIREAGNNIDNIDAFLQRVSDLREMNFPTARPAVDIAALSTPARKRAKFHAPPPTPARVVMTPVGNSTWSNLVAFFSPTPSKPAAVLAPPPSARASAMKPTRLWSFDTASPRKTPPTSSFRHREGVENAEDVQAVEMREMRKSASKRKRDTADHEYTASPIFAKSPRMARTPPIAKSPIRSPLSAMR